MRLLPRSSWPKSSRLSRRGRPGSRNLRSPLPWSPRPSPQPHRLPRSLPSRLPRKRCQCACTWRRQVGRASARRRGSPPPAAGRASSVCLLRAAAACDYVCTRSRPCVAALVGARAAMAQHAGPDFGAVHPQPRSPSCCCSGAGDHRMPAAARQGAARRPPGLCHRVSQGKQGIPAWPAVLRPGRGVAAGGGRGSLAHSGPRQSGPSRSRVTA